MSLLTHPLISALICSGIAITEGQPTYSVAPVPDVPYVILAADRDQVRSGDTVHFTVTFANPTEKKVMLPQVFSSNDEEGKGFSRIAHTLIVKRNGIESPIRALSIDSIPPNIQYLAPRARKTYKFMWTSPYEGKGVVELKFTFGTQISDSFPPVVLSLEIDQSEQGGAHQPATRSESGF